MVLDEACCKELNVQRLGGSTEVFSVEMDVRQPTAGKKAAATFLRKKYVVKRGGSAVHTLGSSHAASEFFANVCYQYMGVNVPATALYHIDVSASQVPLGGYYLLLVEFIDGSHPEAPDQRHLAAIVGKDKAGKDKAASKDSEMPDERRKRALQKEKYLKDVIPPGLRKALQANMAADIVLANYDVVGDQMTNLIMTGTSAAASTSSAAASASSAAAATSLATGLTYYRIDQGGCLLFNPRGESRAFDGTQVDTLKTLGSFLNIAGEESARLLRRFIFAGDSSQRTNGDPDGNLKDEEATKVRKTLSEQAMAVLEILKFEKRMLTQLHAWSTSGLPTLPIWYETLQVIVRRLAVLREDVHEVSVIDTFVLAKQPPPAPVTDFNGLVDIPQTNIVIKLRHKYTLDKRQHDEAEGWTVVDVTSGSADIKGRFFSPFYPHGDIPVPFLRSPDVAGELPHYYSRSVEGVWQGLKMFTKQKVEGVDVTKFQFDWITSANELDIKRPKGSKKKAADLGATHFGGYVDGFEDYKAALTDPNDQGIIRLDYKAAREKIYLPTYEANLRTNLKPLLLHLIKQAKLEDGGKLILLDYFDNPYIDQNKPLSHAQLLKNFILTGQVYPADQLFEWAKAEEEAKAKAKRKRAKGPADTDMVLSPGKALAVAQKAIAAAAADVDDKKPPKLARRDSKKLAEKPPEGAADAPRATVIPRR